MILSINFSGKSVLVFLTSLVCLLALAMPGECATKLHIAILPVENLSGTSAPLKQIRQSLIESLKKHGADIIDEEALESFMLRHRLRYVGGIDQNIATAFRAETLAEAVLITSLELYNDVYPPKIALTSRLVSTGDNVQILWMDGVGLTGDDSPGILGLGLIKDPETLLKNAVRILSGSLSEYLKGATHKTFAGGKIRKKFLPKISYLSPVMARDIKYSVAVIPFYNLSERKYAGDIMGLHFIRQLRKLKNFDVIEPGLIREALLKFRVVMDGGVALSDITRILSRLDADLVLTGNVLTYHDYHGSEGIPKVDFSAMIIERKSHEVIWASKNYNEGDDGVFFFDLGRVNTAHAMASEMTRGVVEKMAE